MEVDIINKILSILIVFLVSMMVFAPATYAWQYNTHKNIITKVYDQLPTSVRTHLNLDLMLNGSTDPDSNKTISLPFTKINFVNDMNNHVYNKTYNKTVYWLKKARSAYNASKYDEASYYFGVASHYIADTGSGPHCVTNDTRTTHRLYESQAFNMTPVINVNSIKTTGTVINTLLNEYNFGKTEWNNWNKSKNNPKYVQANLNYDTSVAYYLIYKQFKILKIV
jgi:hypothetical protein